QIRSEKQVGLALVSAKIGKSGMSVLDDSGVKVLPMAFVAKDVDPSNSYFTVTSGERVAGDNANPHQVMVSLFDEVGAPSAIDPALIVGSASGGAVVGSFALVDGTQSSYVADVTSDSDGSKTVSVSVSGHAVNAVPGEGSSVVFVPGAVSLARSDFTVSDGSIPADGTAAHTITVRMRDALGNGIDGLAARLTAEAVQSTVVLPFVPAGKGVYTALVTSVVKGDHVVTAAIDEAGLSVLALGNDLARFANSGPASTVTSSLTVSQVEQTVGEFITATVTVRDDQNNLFAGHPVTVWTTPDTTPAPLMWHGVTDEFGQVRVSFTSQTAGEYAVFAALDSDANSDRLVNGSGSRIVLFTAEVPSAATTTLGGTDSFTKLVNVSSDPHRAWVMVTDKWNNPVSGAGTSVTFLLSGLTGATLSSTGPILVDDSGRAEVSITSATEGTAVVGARVSQVGAPTIDVVNPADHLDLPFGTTSALASKSNYVLTSGDKTANEVDAHSITVCLRDANGARVHHAEAVISVTFPGAKSGQVPVLGSWTEGTNPATSYGDYTALITSRYAGVFEVHVAVGDVVEPQEGSPSSIRFVPGAISGARSSVEVTTGAMIANGIAAHTVTATLRDALGNLVSGEDGALHGQATPATVGAFDEVSAGVYSASVTSLKAGSWLVEVRHDDLGAALSSGVLNDRALFVSDQASGAASVLELVSSNPKLVAVGLHKVRVTVRDGQSNPVASQAVRVFADPALDLPLSGNVVTDGSGVAELEFTALRAGFYTLFAEIPVVGGVVSPVGSGEVVAEFRSGPVDVTSASTWFSVSQHAGVVADGDASQTLTVS
ncbi:MAG: Ig-like domain-containing protein, partial [Micrococcales bacterium]|nr:Ig-like domain-containing protein [Micrococcales bacterium]